MLDLNRLRGPSNLEHENFELLCLELLKALEPDSECFRFTPPDGGIDIMVRHRGELGTWCDAYQCKAYRTFRRDLITSLHESVEKAWDVKRQHREYDWLYYNVLIPFVPNLEQRKAIEKELEDSAILFHLFDGDFIETALFRFPDIARRFFTNIVIVTARTDEAITFGAEGDPTLCDYVISSVSWGQTLRLKANPNALIRSVLNYVIEVLKLPTHGMTDTYTQYKVLWEFVEKGTERALDGNRTFSENGVPDGAVLLLRYTLHLSCAAGYAAGELPTEHFLQLFHLTDVIRWRLYHLDWFLDRSLMPDEDEPKWSIDGYLQNIGETMSEATRLDAKEDGVEQPPARDK